jgi:hypothetical protein
MSVPRIVRDAMIGLVSGHFGNTVMDQTTAKLWKWSRPMTRSRSGQCVPSPPRPT